MTTALIITGPTATGKTHLAVQLARRFNGEIISADSRQVYRGMDLGTGKDLEEYGTGSDRVPVHLIDIADPQDDFHLKRFLELAQAALSDIKARGKCPVIAGGTPLYVYALLKGYTLPGGEPDSERRHALESLSHEALMEKWQSVATPELLNRTDITQDKRIIRAIEIALSGQQETLAMKQLEHPLVLAPYYPRAVVRQRIELRLYERLEKGLVEEIDRLHRQGVPWEKMEWFGLEYRYISRYLRGCCIYEQMRTDLLAKIRHFAKSQDIWFRKMEREGISIHWLPEGNLQEASSLVQQWTENKPLPPPVFRLCDHLNGPQDGTHPSRTETQPF